MCFGAYKARKTNFIRYIKNIERRRNMFLIVSIFFAGALSFFSPCIIPLLPVYCGMLIDGQEDKVIYIRKRKFHWLRFVKTIAFALGSMSVLILLGFGVGWIGKWLQSAYLKYVVGIFLIVMGLHQTELIHIRSLYRQKQISLHNMQANGQIGKAFLLGVGLSLGWSPCIGPILSSVLALSVTGKNVFHGALYTLVYSLGFTLPFMVVTLFSSLLMDKMKKLNRYTVLLKRIGGGLIILMGVLMIFADINVLGRI